MKENYVQQVQLPSGVVHVYAAPELFKTLDYQIFQIANNNLQIPNQKFMSYTPDVHVGVGTCIGTTVRGMSTMVMCRRRSSAAISAAA